MPELLEDGRIEDEQKRLSTEGIDECGAVLSIRVEAVHFGVEDDGLRLLDTKAWQGSGRGHDNGDDTATTTGGRAREGERAWREGLGHARFLPRGRGGWVRPYPLRGPSDGWRVGIVGKCAGRWATRPVSACVARREVTRLGWARSSSWACWPSRGGLFSVLFFFLLVFPFCLLLFTSLFLFYKIQSCTQISISI